MKQTQENATAIAMLMKVLETQPNIVQNNKGKSSGKRAAEFCIEFVKTYENSLKQSQEAVSKKSQEADSKK